MRHYSSGRTCVDCGAPISDGGTRCRRCASRRSGKRRAQGLPPEGRPAKQCADCGSSISLHGQRCASCAGRLQADRNIAVILRSAYEIDAETGCWVWRRSLNPWGYGVTKARQRTVAAHRLFYQELRGPIPDGMELDHLCRNRACVNPAHLEPVTEAINTQRSGAAKLTPEAIRQIRSLAGTTTNRAIAAKFGVSASLIGRIIHRRSWKNVD